MIIKYILGFGVVFEGKWLNNSVAIKEMIVSYDEVVKFNNIHSLKLCRLSWNSYLNADIQL